MTPEPLFLTETVYNGIVAHAQEGTPQEVCGILGGCGDRVFQLVRGRNVAPDPVKDYVVDSQTLLRQFDFEEKGSEMVAIYHSHPASPAYPSASDAWNAYYPDVAYLICSLENRETPVVRAFRLIGHDVELDPDALSANLDFDETRPGRFAYYQAVGTPIPAPLRAACGKIPRPFYVVYEASADGGKDFVSRAVSITEYQIRIVPD